MGDGVTLRDYIESRLEAERAMTEQQFQALKAATDLVATTSSERFASVNEFRGQLSDQQKLFITRIEVDGLVSVVEKRVDVNTEQINELRRMNANLAGRIAAFGSVFAVVVIAIEIGLRYLH